MAKLRKPHRIKKRKSFFGDRFFWLAVLILIIFGGIFYLIFFHSFFQIKVIEISGNQKVRAENLENLLKERINQKVLLFSSKSIFLVNFGDIKKEILKNFPQVEEVNLKGKFPETLLSQLKEREAAAIFCPLEDRFQFEAGAEETDQKETCFFVDKTGIVFEFININLGRENLVKLKRGLNGAVNLGEKIIKEEELSKILEVEAKLKNELKIPSEEFLIVSEEKFDVKTLEGWRIYFNFQEDLDWQLTKLKAVLEKEIPQEKRKDLEYLDVRFGNFAPYKYGD